MTLATASRGQARLQARLPEHLERCRWDRDRIQQHQRSALRALLRHAKDHSPFHAARLAHVDTDAVTPTDLTALPTMTKADMMANFDTLVTDDRLSLQLVEAHLAATGSEASLLLDQYVVLASGGSSGERGVFVYPFDGIVEYMLALIRSSAARLLRFGEPPPGGFPMAMVAAPRAVHATRALASLFSGGLISVTVVPVSLPVEEIVVRLNELRPMFLQGYPSMLSVLAEEQVAGRLRITPRTVTASSEQLLPEARNRIRNAFGVPVIDQFGSTEGVLGVTAPDEDVMALASDVAIVELVDEADRPVPAGAPSAKVLVTCLINDTQPLIRYELTDRFVRHDDATEHGHLRVTVEGRSDDILDYDGVVVHPLTVRSVLVAEPPIVEYQARQTSDGLDLDVVASAALDNRRLGRALQAALARAGVPQPVVTIRRVDAIERQPGTGKARRFLPLQR